jgi:hypothetical protein
VKQFVKRLYNNFQLTLYILETLGSDPRSLVQWVDEIIKEKLVNCHFQPIVTAKEEIFGYEILSRFKRKDGTLVYPNDMFLSEAKAKAEAEAKAAAASSGGSELFANCTELRKKYPDGVASDHPAYQSKMDRDKDNFACER